MLLNAGVLAHAFFDGSCCVAHVTRLYRSTLYLVTSVFVDHIEILFEVGIIFY